MRRPLAAVAATVLLLFAGARPASAHASFPGQSTFPADTDQRLTLDVPGERGDAAHNVGVKVFMPANWRALSCQAAAPWRCELSTDSASGRAVVGWTRDAGAPGPDDETFVFSAHTGAPGTATFPVHQIYDSGETVRWIGAPGSDEPAPTLQVVPGPSTTATTAPAATTATTRPATTTTTGKATTTTTVPPATTTTQTAASSTTTSIPAGTTDSTALTTETTGQAGAPASSSSSSGWVVAVLVLAALAALAVGGAVVMLRRRGRPSGG